MQNNSIAAYERVSNDLIEIECNSIDLQFCYQITIKW